MSSVDPFAVRALLGPDAVVCRRALTGEPGVALPPFVDHHVHLHLFDEGALLRGGIAGVVDLGGDPALLARRRRDGLPRVAYAGAFLTPPGGYPSGRSWAPDTIVQIVADASAHPGVQRGAATAVDEQATSGASVIKVALNAIAGPVFDRDVLDAIVATAHERGLPVVAHVEGEGMTRLALDAGVDVLAHTPFAETLETTLVERVVAAGQRWISTLDIHRDDPLARPAAIANLRAFVAAGGRVLYGTDLGNGDLPVSVNSGELTALHEAGVAGSSLIDALADPWPFPEPTDAVVSFVPGAAPATADEVPAFLARARVIPAEEVVPDER